MKIKVIKRDEREQPKERKEKKGELERNVKKMVGESLHTIALSRPNFSQVFKP